MARTVAEIDGDSSGLVGALDKGRDGMAKMEASGKKLSDQLREVTDKADQAAGAIVEKISGQAYETFVRERVLEGASLSVEPAVRRWGGAAGLTASMPDLVRFVDSVGEAGRAQGGASSTVHCAESRETSFAMAWSSSGASRARPSIWNASSRRATS